MAIKGTKSGGMGENPWGDGNIQFILVGAKALMGKKFETDEAIPQVTLTYKDPSDGDTFEEKFVNIPKGFGINDKAKLIERIASCVGKSAKALADEADDGLLEFDCGPGIEDWDTFYSELASGRQVALGIKYSGENVFNKSLMLQLETSEKGFPKVRGSSPVPTTPIKKKSQPVPTQELESVI
jgi:hypothetical protein